jgi:hypothetical protein
MNGPESVSRPGIRAATGTRTSTAIGNQSGDEAIAE